MIPWLSKNIIKYIIWDLDGTLYQNEEIGKKIKNYFYNRLKKVSPNLTPKKFEQLSQTYGSWASAINHHTQENIFDILDDLDKVVCRSSLITYDKKIVDLIETKLTSYHHLILTNSGIDEALKCLKKIGFKSKTFEKIYARDTINLLKPDPNIYPIIKQHTRTFNFRHLFVGDSIAHDIIAPKKFGFQAVPIWEIDKIF